MSGTPLAPGEMRRIVVTLTIVCALSAGVLGATYVGTERYAAGAQLAREEAAVREMLQASPDAQLMEVRQFIEPARIVYSMQRLGAESASPRTIAFTFGGSPSAEPIALHAGVSPTGRVFVALRGGAAEGFVVESAVRGYKNRVRFLVALDSSFTVRGVRVVEHEEDPGLGAEIATPRFVAQFAGRSATQVAGLDVTRDPMPEDWSAALLAMRRMPPGDWQKQYGTLAAREAARPIYAVTGATISSRALTGGVRDAAQRFARRWALLAPWVTAGAGS